MEKSFTKNKKIEARKKLIKNLKKQNITESHAELHACQHGSQVETRRCEYNVEL